MKMLQSTGYKPITIVLETREEAISFFDIMDKIGCCNISVTDHKMSLSVESCKLATKFSNDLTLCKVVI